MLPSNGLDDRLRSLLRRYSGAGPRYTSYPPAPCFRTEVDADYYGSRLEALGATPETPLSLYVHIPFCKEMCSYCGCNVIVARNSQRADGYLDMLEREIDAVGARLGTRRPLAQLHLGGGTPTFLDVEQLRRLGGLIARHFDVEPVTEASVEIDPVVTSEEQLAVLRGFGFNRVSIGVQDLDPTVQCAVNRIQPVEITVVAMEAARRLGYRSINLDLMYGLPHQTTATFLATIQTVVGLRPDRLALFGYAHVPWIKPHQRRLDAMPRPDGEERIQLFLSAAERLREAGYVQIGLDHFAAPSDDLAVGLATGEVRRNFQGYTARRIDTTIAVGVSGIGDFGDAYLQNHHRIERYEAVVTAGGLPIERGYVLTRDDRFRRALIDRLMCHLSVDLQAIAGAFGYDARTDLVAEVMALDALADDGLVEREGQQLRVTELGRLFLRNVAMVFDRHLGTPATADTGPVRPRYSSTV